MLVNKSIETENGTVKFEGELEQNELDFVLKIGLNYLLTHGALPFTTVGKDKEPVIAEPATEVSH
jgi:hypothetical protein